MGIRRGRARFTPQHIVRISPRDARTYVPAEGLQDRDAGGDVADVDFEDSGHGVWHTDPGQIFGLDLPRGSCPGDGDPPRDDSQPHQEAQTDFAPLPDFEIPQEDDWECGADEVGGE